MSARQRFVAGANVSSAADSSSTAIDPAQPAENTSPFVGNPNALRDKSNSPRPQPKKDTPHAQKKSDNKNKNASAALPSDGVQVPKSKPLNLSSLHAAKGRKADDGGQQGQNKKMRVPAVDRLKENRDRYSSNVQSPRARPLSPSSHGTRLALGGGPPQAAPMPDTATRTPRVQRSIAGTLMPANASLLVDDSIMTQVSTSTLEGQSMDFTRAHIHALNPAMDNSYSEATQNSFAASGQALMDSYPALSSRTSTPRARPLDPARREVYPLRSGPTSPADPAHIVGSLSPAMHPNAFATDRVMDYHAPLRTGSGSPDVHQEQHTLRRTTKRINQREQDEGTDGSADGRGGKRPKFDPRAKGGYMGPPMDGLREPIRNRAPTPMHHYTTPAHSDAYEAIDPRTQGYQSPPPPQNSVPSVNEEIQGISRLFGIDAEQYLMEHVEQYEAAKKRWTECDLEEWEKGADQVAANFASTIDLVKNHISTKMKLFASFRARVDQHKTVLDERATSLKSVREKLVKDSGAVLGGASGSGLTPKLK